MPPFRELFAQELRRRYAGVGDLTDVSVGGIGTQRGLELVDAVLESKPDLVVMAFGMNDAGWLSVDEYVGNIAQMVERIRADAPEAEIILVASMLGNPEWHNTPMPPFFGFRDGLRSLCCEGVAVTTGTARVATARKSSRSLSMLLQIGSGGSNPGRNFPLRCAGPAMGGFVATRLEPLFLRRRTHVYSLIVERCLRRICLYLEHAHAPFSCSALTPTAQETCCQSAHVALASSHGHIPMG